MLTILQGGEQIFFILTIFFFLTEFFLTIFLTIFFILAILQGGEPSEQHRELFPGSTALRPDEGIADQETGEDTVSVMKKMVIERRD